MDGADPIQQKLVCHALISWRESGEIAFSNFPGAVRFPCKFAFSSPLRQRSALEKFASFSSTCNRRLLTINLLVTLAITDFTTTMCLRTSIEEDQPWLS
jgi:hypothetical protein